MDSYLQRPPFPDKGIQIPSGFPHSPSGWSHKDAKAIAQAEGLTLTDEHWQLIRSLQAYYAHKKNHQVITVRELHDALEKEFGADGGLKLLHEILPGGPVAQGCRLAGLDAPPGAADPSFGSTV